MPHGERLSELGGINNTFDAPAEDEPRYTNHYLCPKDDTRWDAGWSCMCNDRCPTCDAVVEPYATTHHADDGETIHNQAVYNKANVVGE